MNESVSCKIIWLSDYKQLRTDTFYYANFTNFTENIQVFLLTICNWLINHYFNHACLRC